MIYKLGVSDKIISKWETGKDYPDIMLLEPIADALSVMLRSKFYVCPVCGNVIQGIGEAVVHCHGVLLQPEEAEETDEEHKIFIERVEDEYYVKSFLYFRKHNF